MKIEIHFEVAEELGYRREMIEDNDDWSEEEKRDAVTAIDLLLDGRHDELTPAQRDALDQELTMIVDTDWIQGSGARRKRWLELMARLGMLEKFNPNALYSRKPRTITVDGVKYEC